MLDDEDAYGAYQEGTRLLAADDVHAAAVALERARDLEPAKGSIREALARAYFRAARYVAAEIEFRSALELDPVNDYAHFGIAMCRLRAGDRVSAVGHLRLAVAMRPDNDDYNRALADATAGERGDAEGASPAVDDR